MASDMGVSSLSAVASVSRKDTVKAAKGPHNDIAPRVSSDDARASVVEQAQKQPERDELEQSVRELNGLVQKLHRELRFSVDDNSGEVVVSIVDRETNEVVRQIPSEEVLQLRQRLEDSAGAIFSGKA